MAPSHAGGLARWRRLRLRTCRCPTRECCLLAATLESQTQESGSLRAVLLANRTFRVASNRRTPATKAGGVTGSYGRRKEKVGGYSPSGFAPAFHVDSPRALRLNRMAFSGRSSGGIISRQCRSACPISRSIARSRRGRPAPGDVLQPACTHSTIAAGTPCPLPIHSPRGPQQIESICVGRDLALISRVVLRCCSAAYTDVFRPFTGKAVGWPARIWPGASSESSCALRSKATPR